MFNKKLKCLCTDRLTEAQEDAILSLLTECSEDFLPSLTSRGGVLEYMKELRGMSYILALDSDVLCGFMAFKVGSMPEELSIIFPSCQNRVHVKTVLVASTYRGMGIMTELYGHLFRLDVTRGQYIVKRTWSTNERHLGFLKAHDFSCCLTIYNDRCPGVHSVFYERLNTTGVA